MTDSNPDFLNYLAVKKIITISTFLAAFTYGYVPHIKDYIMDPIFDYFFPIGRVEDMNIILSDSKQIRVGKFILETVRWILYMLIFYTIYKRIPC